MAGRHLYELTRDELLERAHTVGVPRPDRLTQAEIIDLHSRP